MGSGPDWSTGVRMAVCRRTPSRTGIMTSWSLKIGFAGASCGAFCAAADMAINKDSVKHRMCERTSFLRAAFLNEPRGAVYQSAVDWGNCRCCSRETSVCIYETDCQSRSSIRASSVLHFLESERNHEQEQRLRRNDRKGASGALLVRTPRTARARRCHRYQILRDLPLDRKSTRLNS